jgi:hypothetical protein
MADNRHLSGPISPKPAHWSQRALEVTVIDLNRLFALCSAWRYAKGTRLVEHARIESSTPG